MAPLEQIRVARSLDLRQRQNCIDNPMLRKRDGKDSNGNGRGRSGNGNGNRRDGNGGGGGNGNSGGGGRGGGGGGGGRGSGSGSGGGGGDRTNAKDTTERTGNENGNDSQGNNNGNENGNGNGNGNGNDRSGGGGGGNKGNGNGNNGNNNRPPDSTPAEAPPESTVAPPAAESTVAPPPPPATSTIMNTINTTSVIMVTSTTGVPAAPLDPAPTSSDIPPPVPATTTPVPEPTLSSEPTPFITPSDESTQPRKGVEPNSDTLLVPTAVPVAEPITTPITDTEVPNDKSGSSSIPTIPLPETVLGSGLGPAATTSVALPAQNESPSKGDSSMTPLAQNLLIAAGTIGALIIFMTAIYVIARIKKIDLFAFFRNREFRRGGDRGWYGWRSKLTPYYPSTASFTSFTYVSDEKPILPSPQPIATTLPTATALSPVSPVSPMSVVFPVLHVVNPEAHLSQNPVPPQDVAFSPQRNPAPFAVSAASKRQEQNPPSANATYPTAQEPMNNNTYQLNLENYSNTYNTNTTFTSSNAYDPAQREVNHLSYLSSLSSGFGDGQILIPRATTELDDPTGSASDQSRKFSWVSSSRMRDRDTTYTTASVESTPHFRTVNSWVAQQAGRAERHQHVNTDVPAVPDIPLPLKINSDHQRNLSEMTAFKQHPGNEIELQKGKRIPSEILDKKTGIN